ncbi:MAG: galactose-1-phosphate uridylyltransferase [Acidobacteriales bacterium]|nr:galactose-1-phosphate uridylyltransferase [Candidatus Koribacter versatilis]MBI3645481.1 galactose-1-phosphate uridylyltransferase [Terriglobales bacterium]
MPELRQNFATKEWVIIATERARRPEQMVQHRERKPLAPFVASCPFCPGNEGLTPPEVLRVPASTAVPWHVRVVPNKFAALSREVEPTRTVHRSRRTVNGFGVHDVVIETPDHAQVLALMPDSYVAEILRVYKTRYDELSLDPRIAHITIFKNHGADAGTSLEHPHSQLIATPVISHQVRERFQHALRHHDDFGECMFCQMLEEEMEEQARVVMTSEHFVALELFASPAPFCTHIYPRRHMASFGDVSAAEINDLARMLRTMLAKLYHGLKDPDFNFTLRSAPAENFGVKYFHWYVSIIPRLTRVAGFELGSGMFINTVVPEAAAEFLRKVDVESTESAAAAATQ